MATEQFANNVATTLSEQVVDGSDNHIHVTAETGFPASAQYRVLVDSEIMIVTGGIGTGVLTVTRGAEGTTAAHHGAGAAVTHVLTAGALAQTIDDHNALALHSGTAGEIAALTEKTMIVSGDTLLIEDSQASNAKKKALVSSLPLGMTNPMTTQDDIIVGGDASYINEALVTSGASAITTENPGTAVNAIDGNETTYWSSTSYPFQGPWLKVDLGVAKTILGHRLVQSNSNRITTQYKVEYSFDNSSWSLAYLSPTGLGAGTFLVQHSSAVKARYWRITALAGTSFYWYIYTFGLNSGTPTGAPTRLAKGTDGQVLTVDASTHHVAWKGLPAAQKIQVSTADVSNPPTGAELGTALGQPATVGAGYVAILDDAGAGQNVYLAVSDGANWWYQLLTKAT